MGRYMLKPKEIEAWQWTGTTLADAWEFCEANKLPYMPIASMNGKVGLKVQNHIVSIATRGDYILKHPEIEGLCVMAREDFEKMYHPIQDEYSDIPIYNLGDVDSVEGLERAAAELKKIGIDNIRAMADDGK